jgi:N-acetylneuraminate synthase
MKTYIIAEVGVNHNGSLEMAFSLIDAAVNAGADAIKFQTFKTENVVSKHAPKADYQMQTTDSNESQLEMLKKLELDEAAHEQLITYCHKKNIQFLSTPFDSPSLKLLTQKFNLHQLKIPSGEITNAPFLLEIARTGKPVILSTGMATLGEIETALAILAFGFITNLEEKPSLKAFNNAYCSSKGQKILQQNVTILHCTTKYPTPYNEVNLYAMDTLKSAFNLPVGYSDHTAGIAVPIAAVARGAKVIEKHFTLDRHLPGPDHKASLEPDELTKMVKSIRQIELALGNSLKAPTKSEIKNQEIARKSLVASDNIKKGGAFTEKNITIKRPGSGVSPTYYWEILGKIADRDYQVDELIQNYIRLI